MGNTITGANSGETAIAAPKGSQSQANGQNRDKHISLCVFERSC